MFGKQKTQLNIAHPQISGTFARKWATVAFVCAYLITSVVGGFVYQVTPAEAAIPKLINFQGKLTAVSNGSNVANGTYAFEFKLYNDPTAGSLLWTETYDQVAGACAKLTVTNGVFNAKLGNCASLASIDFTGGALYLTVNFAPTGTSYDGEMTPRKQLVSSAYAFVANSVSGDGVVNNAIQSTTALSTGRTSANPALQVDTNTASSVTGLKVTSAAAAGGLALAVISSGTDENLTIDAKGAGTISLGASSTGNVLLAGGSGSTGCTVTNSTGAFACTAGGSFTTGTFTSSGSGNVAITNNTLTNTAGLLGVTVITGSDFTPGIANSYTQTATGNLTSGAGITNGAFSNAVVTGGSVGQNLYGIYNSAVKTGADTATGTYNTYGSYNIASNTGRTNVGTVNTYGGYFTTTGDTAGTSTAYGIYATATGADANYAIIVPNGGGSVGIGDSTPLSLFTVGNGDLFQVNSSGAIAAAAGIISSGTIQFSSLTTNGALYTSGGNGTLTTTAPTSGALGYWSRSGTVLSPTTSGDTVSIGALSAATSTALTIGAMTGATADTGIDIGNISTGTTQKGINIGTFAGVNGGTVRGIQISTITGAATTTSATSIDLGAITSTNITTSRGILIGAMSGTGTTGYGIDIATITKTGTTATAINIGGLSGAATTNTGLAIGAVTGATNNYALTTNGGYVGIGTTTPTALLDVQGSYAAAVVGSIVNNSATGYGLQVATPNNTSASYYVANFSSGGVSRLTVNAGGNVGINTTGPDRKLDILDASNPQLRLTYTDGSVYTDLQTTSSGYLYMNPSGARVGIGTNAPTNMLDVSGTAGFGFENLELNGGFEYGDFTAAYTNVADGGSGGLTVTSGGGWEGTYFVRNSAQVGSHSFRLRPTFVIPTDKASLSYYGRRSGVANSWGSSPANGLVTPITLYLYDETSATTVCNTGSNSPGTTWTRYNVSCSITAGHTFSVQVMMDGWSGQYNADIDAVQVEAGLAVMEYGAPLKLSTNGGGYIMGNIGIGTTPSSSAYQINQTYTSSTAGSVIGHLLAVTGTSTSATAVVGIQAAVNISGTGNAGSSITGGYFSANDPPTNVSAMTGVYGFAGGSGGTAGNIYGVRGNALSEEMTTTNGVYGGHFTTSFGTTAYGVYASAEDCSTCWAFYGESGNNYLANSTAIGTTTTTAGKLTVAQSDGANLPGIYINTEESTTTQSVFAIESDTATGSGADTVKFKITADGSVYSDANVYGTPADVAEMYNISGPVTAGDVVEIVAMTGRLDGEKFGVKRHEPTSNAPVLGVISTAPGTTLGYEWKRPDILAQQKPVALVGRVPIKVTNENGAIMPGDFLVASATQAGYAMKATKAGPVIGQALDKLTGTTGSITAFIKPTNYNGVAIEDQIAGGLEFDYSDAEKTAYDSEKMLNHLIAQLDELDYNNLSQINTDLVVAGAEVVSPNVTTQTLRTDFLSSATADGSLTVASATIMNGGLIVDEIGSVGGLLSIMSDVEFFGTPYFTVDTAGFAVIKAGVQSVDITFSREYLAQPIVNASVSFEQDVDQTVLDEEAREVLKADAIAAAQSFLAEGVSYVITNKSRFGFTIVLSKPAPTDVKLSWTALAVRNASTFMSLSAPEGFVAGAGDPGAGDGSGDSGTPPPGDGSGDGSGDGGETPPPSDPPPSDPPPGDGSGDGGIGG